MKYMVSGSHGLVGSALTKQLEQDGHTVIRLSRDLKEATDFEDIEAVIHLAGESIAEGRWSTAKKKRIEDSRVIGTKRLSELIAAAVNKPSVFISASAIGFYGNRSDELLEEGSSAGTGFLPHVCLEWEQASKRADTVGVRTVNIRTGIVLDTQGGALKKMLPPFKMGGGGILGSGKQYMSWISLADMVSAIQFITKEKSLSGPVNLTAPTPVTNKDFTSILGAVLKRPTFMPLPAFAARLIFGEMAEELLLSSTRVKPNKLLQSGYKFHHKELKPALEDILK
ncbi:TIGR01777 family oxidoreductase [Pontiellaceae bacterium B12227]|nr:TIGR01777 family oxidoreductase [Pontiellaceae bacterium B12227]